ncbi:MULTISPECIES: hypothetical protein [Gammaproteobacteria]|nr:MULTISPECIES: hypothetical protein [Gammaproteobacteria]MBA5159997.1 hypothetical protein [Pseudomonas aeruginosa]QIH07770.1 hypothetical protein ATY02_14175 [Pseudomonas sp. BIOMIG1BAC]QIH10948.1 hypothetical protein ATY02_31515 [Pseudomonas sp. BIOMIG1BAC]HBO1490261.1 hypothetical protein [Pseudomonas aeruginosa]HBO1496465.1 hypothetical protein [Pseudomonas aeruginosa]
MMGTPLEILLVLTSQATMGDDPRLTGVWFEEQSTPYYALVDAGANVDIASIAGGEIPVDPHSIASEGMNPPSVECFLDDKVSMDKLEGSLKIDSIAPEGGAVMFLPGGHGTMWDLPGAGRSSICCRALGLTAGWSRRSATAEPDWLMSRKRMASRWLPAVASAPLPNA